MGDSYLLFLYIFGVVWEGTILVYFMSSGPNVYIWVFLIPVVWLISYFILWFTYERKFFLIYFEREKEGVWEREGRGRERGREKIPSRLCAVRMEPNTGLYLINCETWAKIKSRMLNQLSHPGALFVVHFLLYHWAYWSRPNCDLTITSWCSVCAEKLW